MEFDFGQIEVVVLAFLSRDRQLIQDIIDGVDMHVVNAANMYNISPTSVTKYQRKVAKGCTFQLQYGAGPHSMAKTWKIPVSLANRFIDEYYGRYPQVKAWQANNIKAVKASRWEIGRAHV